MVYTQPMVVKMDPRVKTTARDLKSQFELSFMCYNERIQAREAMAEIDRFGEQMGELLPKALPELSAQLRGLQQQASDLRNGAQGGKGQNFSRTERSFATVFSILQGADMPPTQQAATSARERRRDAGSRPAAGISGADRLWRKRPR